MTEKHEPLFEKYAINLTHAKKNASLLRDYTQISLILDTLSRKERHHVMLLANSSEKTHLATMSCIAEYLTTDTLPASLKKAHFVYLDLARFAVSGEKQKHIEHDFQTLCEEADAENKLIIFAMNHWPSGEPETALGRLEEQIKAVLSDPRWRLILITHSAHYQEIAKRSPYLNIFLSD